MKRILPPIAFLSILCGHVQSAAALKTETFDRDPGWEGYHNRIVPKSVVMVKQDFGYGATHFAGKGAGEVGGVIHRSATPAS